MLYVCALHVYAHVFGRKLDTCCHLSTKFAIIYFLMISCSMVFIFCVICVSTAWFALDSLTPLL